jgi:hypothetical protein
VTFVIAVQDMTAGVSAYGVRLRDIMPTGFVVPTDGIGLTVTDGLGNDLATSGDLFSTAGLTIAPALAGYDPNSGQNVDLITFSLDAGSALPGPYASLTSSAVLAGYSASSGGVDLAAANPASATTTIVTAAPVVVVTPETDPTAVATGQTVSFDVSMAIPAGTLSDLRIGSVLPLTNLSLVSASVVSVGNGLTAGTPTIGADGTISFGTVSLASTNTANNTIVARITVRASGTASGAATLQTVVSASDPDIAGGRWIADVSSTVGVVVPPTAPVLSGASNSLSTGVGLAVNPFSSLGINDPNLGQTGSLAITLQDASLGHFSSMIAGSLDLAGDTFFVTGPLTTLQTDARLLQFTPSGSGTAHFTLTVVDAAGGVAQNASTTVTVAQSSSPPIPAQSPDPLFDAAYYLAHNPDVAAAGVDPYQHYMTYGWHEGRDPSAYFDTNYYLTQNPDVKAAGVNPLLHFEQYGWKEGRQPSLVFDDAKYLAVNTDVAAAGVDPLLHYMQFGQNEGRPAFITGGTAAADPAVNATYYDQQLGATLIPAGAAAAQQAAWSYDATGWQRGLNPDAFFNTSYYLSHNPDVAAAHIDPLLHYETFGWKEGRDPSAQFSTSKYLAAYSDVKAAGVDPLIHYLVFGQNEGRQAFSV